mmetsp:Transcript_16156/g.48396  ORF Transcript_16156/g.48396 Transcript_16156/m.48396 type:complete len:429 (+) Transcript_16156:258-1544(+)
MQRSSGLIALLIAAAACRLNTAAAQPEAHDTLVLIGNEAVRDTHSQFLNSLELLGAQVDIRRSSNSSLQLRNWDSWLYKHVVLLHPEAAELGGALDVPHLVEFVEAGGNLLVGLDSTASEFMRELASELGVDVEPTGNYVVDHFNSAAQDPTHRTVLASGFLPSKALWGARQPQGAVVFKGIGMSVSPESNMAKVVLHAGASAYSATMAPNPRDNPTLGGEQVGLAAVSQTRSDARAVVIGSLDALGNDALGASVPQGSETVAAGNAEFSSSLLRWLLHQRGVLRFGDFVHHRVGEVEAPHAYTIKDQVEFSVKVEELVDGEWQPYRAPDVQLDFTMLDPHVRVFLQHDSQGTFSTAFQIPDVYGVFKWVIEYAAPGYNVVELSEQNPVRPFKHTEYERFLSPAYPYYTSGVATMLAFTALTVVFLYS